MKTYFWYFTQYNNQLCFCSSTSHTYNKFCHLCTSIRVLAMPGGAGRGRPPLTISARHKKKKTISARHYFFFSAFFCQRHSPYGTRAQLFPWKMFGTCTLRPFWSHSHKSANIGTMELTPAQTLLGCARH